MYVYGHSAHTHTHKGTQTGNLKSQYFDYLMEIVVVNTSHKD